MDKLFYTAEEFASDNKSFPNKRLNAAGQPIGGLIPSTEITKIVRRLRKLNVDDYVEETVVPSESQNRPGAKDIMDLLPCRILRQESHGPLLVIEALLDFDGGKSRRVGFIAQDRSESNGVWMPEHHRQASEAVREFANYNIPIVTFMDTPGADAGAEANAGNQAHEISRLIAEFANIDVPTVGIVIGNGYSGGAIPLATTNLLLSVRDGVFNTIQPRGLASIARKYNLSWQECAKYVGVSSYELYQQGYLDGVIDYVPGEEIQIHNIFEAITSGIIAIETSAVQFVAKNDIMTQHLTSNMKRYFRPSSKLKNIETASELSLSGYPTNQSNAFGLAYRLMRYLSLRSRINCTSVSRYGKLSESEIPKGDLEERTAEEHRTAFDAWVKNPLEIKYDDGLRRIWLKYSDKRKDLLVKQKRNRIGQFFLGDPQIEWDKAMNNLALEYGFNLYNLWKDSASNNLISLLELLNDENVQPNSDLSNPTVLDIILQEEIRPRFIQEVAHLILFDAVYDGVINNLTHIALEAKNYNQISKSSVGQMIDKSLEQGIAALRKKVGNRLDLGKYSDTQIREGFFKWIGFMSKLPKRERILKSIEQWKLIAFPRIPEPLFAIVTFFFHKLIPSFLASERSKSLPFQSKIDIRNIGIKDFWNRLDIAYQDLLIHQLLFEVKRRKSMTTEKIIDEFFDNFKETNGDLMSSDPAQFPGFRISIEQALNNGQKPCGAVTGFAEVKGSAKKVGIMVSNLSFQAGAWDMASTEKFCKLLYTAAKRRTPVICFISSGGMQTKEGAGALFSMAIVNDRITRFIRDTNLPVLMFGYGDCTGGAQASLVTHPMVQSYYFSGTNMPFAGQIVVPSYLPNMTTLSNYLSAVPGAMQGLVENPFATDLDDRLVEIDEKIPKPNLTVPMVIERTLEGVVEDREVITDEKDVSAESLLKPVERVLIHARGCAAVKLVRKSIELDRHVILVQSDPDMESVAADLLRESDQLICIGGSTPDESYLNAQSVIRIAERENADALHPGIGFLSENPAFAGLCRRHGINFMGPSVQSMEWMGNKSNATNTAKRLGVPNVPGSEGVLTDSVTASVIAEEIGYPIILKAVHGGGGKGIKVVMDPSKFKETFSQIRAEAKSAFGSPDVYMEKFVQSMRHIEVQILRDAHSNTQVLGLRDCSVQRNNQKIIEESGSTLLPKKLEKAAYDYARMIADEVNYIGAGTVEFIFDLKDNIVYFMEMNTRLQVEHPVTEGVTGVDIVAEQFRIAGGESIKDLKFKQAGYAIELRINAEKMSRTAEGEIEIIPDPGEITKYIFPEKDYIKLISTIDQAKVVSPFYDSMVVQLICHGKDREETVDRLIDYLNEVEIEGVCTNVSLLKRILADEVFRGGDYDTGYLPAFLNRIDVDELINDIIEMAGKQNDGIDMELIQIEGSDELKVLAPSAGVFYTTPSPAEPNLIEPGEIVDVNKSICLLEAMKLFRPINLSSFNQGELELYDSAKKYKVVRVVPTNGQAVNKDDLLFIIAPQ